MNTTRFERHRLLRPLMRTGLAVAVTAMVTAGGTWHVMAAGGSAAPAHAAATAAAPAPAAHAAIIPSARASYADVVKQVAPAVVTIRTEGTAHVSQTALPDDDFLQQFFGRSGRVPRDYKQRSLGSGVVVSADGYILTNHHVIDGADDIRVDLSDGRTLKATVVGSDEPSDLALLKVPATDLHALNFGDSDRVEVGDVVLALGNPLGVGQTVTMGIISAKGRSTGIGQGGYEDFLQTDAPINQGNSGGALVNAEGQLVGINSQILTQSGGNIGIGFAIPVNMARHVMDSLRKDGRVHRAQLGVTIQPLTEDAAKDLGLKATHGAVVNTVVAGSAAARAGIKPGDVITAFEGQPVSDINALRNHIADTAPGSKRTLTIVRDGTERQLTVQLEEAAAQQT